MGAAIFFEARPRCMCAVVSSRIHLLVAPHFYGQRIKRGDDLVS